MKFQKIWNHIKSTVNATCFKIDINLSIKKGYWTSDINAILSDIAENYSICKVLNDRDLTKTIIFINLSENPKCNNLYYSVASYGLDYASEMLVESIAPRIESIPNCAQSRIDINQGSLV